MASDGHGGVVCAAMAMGAAALLAMLAMYTDDVRRKYTPIFSEITCESIEGPPSKLKRAMFPPKLHIQSQSVSACTNPNPFDLEILSGGGQVMLLKSSGTLQPIGRVSVKPSVLPAKSVGQTYNVMDIVVEGLEAVELVGSLLTDTVDIVLNTSARSRTSLSYLGFNKTSVSMARHICGFKMHAGIPQKKGPVRCAESIEQLDIPAVDHPPIKRHIKMPADKFEMASRARDIACYSIIGLSALLSVGCLYCGCRSCSPRRRRDEEALKFLDDDTTSAAE